MLWACRVLVSGEKLPSLEESQHSTSASNSSERNVSQEEASYVCDACGEEIVIPLDLTEGSSQSYVEDCPVCCRANTIFVRVDDDGVVQVWAEPEQDYD
ncbi:MAG: CPXCG motif-containing cysteine-rich protein [Planctomycetaceae bacterium]|nr:CPXCG motif-containing cysteine-rich protein [Planctomycetaceae bacterium]